MSETSVVFVGIGGFGSQLIGGLLDRKDPTIRIAGAVDPAPERCKWLGQLRELGVPICPSMDDFYATHSADLAVLASPIHLHRPHTERALARGSHVMCEKPVCAIPEDIEPMKTARDRAGKLVGIGYQWSFSPAIQALKQDILSGALGAPKRLRAMVLWPRGEQYYGRNNWAGHQKDAQGNWVLDSPVNNATAHYLHNMFYVLGDRVDRSAIPTQVEAELYRANPITNYDTAVLRVKTDRGAELIFCTSHAVERNVGPVFSYEFQNAVVKHGETTGDEIVATFRDGSTRSYGRPGTSQVNKISEMVDCIRHNRLVVCGIEAASSHTQCVWMAQQAEIKTFPKESILIEGAPGERVTRVPGLEDVLTQCYERGTLPSEMGVSWSR